MPTSLGLKHEAIRVIALHATHLERHDLVRSRQPLPEPATEQQGELVDLMAALRESVERTKRQRKAPSKREAL